MKRWNRRNELLADNAERASVIADWLGGAAYPTDALRETWIRFLWHQFHDDLTGTSIPEAYTFSWNDEIIALNRFSSIFEHAAGAGTRALDTRAKGVPLVVYNPIAMDREDVVEATVSFPGAAPKYVRVFGPDGAEVPAQVIEKKGGAVTVLFLAKVPSVGYAVYDARPSATPSTVTTGIAATPSSLENTRYRVRIDRDGNVAGITDKRENRELLSAPARLDLFDNLSKVWPAWEITHDTVTAQPVDYVKNPSSVRVVESSPARVAVEIVRSVGDSRIVQRIRLAAGSDRVEFDTDADWRTRERLLKATFPLAVSNAKATYDLGLGTIQRGNNTAALYEVPAQQWADITAQDASYGVSSTHRSREAMPTRRFSTSAATASPTRSPATRPAGARG
jgi:alpha-mannosidase